MDSPFPLFYHPMRKNAAFLLFAGVMAALFIRLGVWQLDRRAARRARTAAAQTALALPPLEVGRGVTWAKDSLIGRTVLAHGTYDFAAEVAWTGRSYEATPGVYLLTPLRLSDGTRVLVNRGWLPAPDGRRYDTAAGREPETASVRGIGMALPAGRGAPDLPAGVLPVAIQLLPAPDGPAWPVRLARPDLGEGPHLAYALQWFAFALIAVVGSILVVRRRETAA
jgi:surfeit locus 1 family protein